MKKKTRGGLPALLFFIVLSIACRKSAMPDSVNPPSPNGGDSTQSIHTTGTDGKIPYPVIPITDCANAPDYGDTLIYPQPPDGQDYIVSPVNNPGAGKYYSWPEGLDIDSITGAINVTRSETGLKFDIGFVKNGTTDTCLTRLTLAGASYTDSVYVLADNETKAYPYYNANHLQTTAPNGSHFDITKSAYNQKISVNNGTGIIDLKNTLNAFGLLPLNGQTIQTTMYYTLNDGSNNALQQITIQFMYYYQKSQINSGLLSTILFKRLNIFNDDLILKSGKVRPPLIIITRFN